MENIEKLPWYDNYMLIMESRRTAEKSIEDLENPEKQLQRVKKFYQNLGADYSKNQWLSQTEGTITLSNCGQDSRLSQLKREVRLGNVIENAVEKQDDESITALCAYKEDEVYRELVNQIMFYIGVSKARSEVDFIEKACAAIIKKYSPEKTALFIQEGVHYYIYYLQCLQSCLKRYREHLSYEKVKQLVSERCMNLKLMFHSYGEDPYIGRETEAILKAITDTEVFMSDEEQGNE